VSDRGLGPAEVPEGEHRRFSQVLPWIAQELPQDGKRRRVADTAEGPGDQRTQRCRQFLAQQELHDTRVCCRVANAAQADPPNGRLEGVARQGIDTFDTAHLAQGVGGFAAPFGVLAKQDLDEPIDVLPLLQLGHARLLEEIEESHVRSFLSALIPAQR
jgi:hypothetical protein